MENKDKRIEIRCLEIEKEKIMELAGKSNMNLSGFILTKVLGNEKNDLPCTLILKEAGGLLREADRLEYQYPGLNFNEIKERISKICHYLK